MYFYLIGTDYRKAPFVLRESFLRQFSEITQYWRKFPAQETVILRTCNRIEIYGIAEDAQDAQSRIRDFSAAFPLFYRHSYIKAANKEVFRHALRLASGLESQLAGETQILNQLKAWSAQPDFPHPFKALWGKALALAQEVRFRSGLDADGNNLASIVFADLRRRITFNAATEIIIVGTGKIAELFSQYLLSGVKLNFAAHKNYSRAKILAQNSAGDALCLKDLPAAIPRAAALIGATSSPHYVLKKEHFKGIENKRNSLFYVYDLALPRDIDPAVREINEIFLQDMHDLEETFQRYNQDKLQNLGLAAYLVEEALKQEGEAVYAKGN